MRRVPLALAALGGATALALAPAAGAAAWDAPVRISPPDRAAYSAAAAAAGPGGAALAAWIRTPAGAPRAAGRLQLAERRAGRGWSRAWTLSGPGASEPRVALSARGDAAAAWLNGRLLVAAVRRGPEGRWRPGRVAEAGAPVQDLLISLDRRGRPTATWVERRDDRYQVRLATGDAGGEWSVRATGLSTPGPDPPALALSPGRGALASWVDDGRVVASRTSGGTFEPPVELSDPDATRPGVAMDASGGSLAAWSARLPGGTSVLQASSRPADAPGWAAPEDVSIGGSPAVAINASGDAVAAWGAGSPEGEQSVAAGTRQGGGVWRASTIVTPRDCDCALGAAAAALDGAGQAVVAWRRDGGDPAGAAGASALAANGDRWEQAPIPAARLADPPAVAAAPTAGALVVWSLAAPGGGVRAIARR